jgi:hypothetical protein
MKLSKVFLREGVYDPRTGKEGGLYGRSEFSADEGYTIELSNGVLTVRYEDMTVALDAGRMKHAFLMPEPALVAVPADTIIVREPPPTAPQTSDMLPSTPQTANVPASAPQNANTQRKRREPR